MLLKDSQFYVYLLTNRPHGTLYTGMTNNLMRRIWEHKNKINEGFSKRYDLSKLVYFEIFKSPADAITREKRIKKWKRQWKIELIEAMNPHWKDLSEGWY
ncbi:MAG: GIY-YIG nuclease family protein [Flavobacteriaceae bacterium]